MAVKIQVDKNLESDRSFRFRVLPSSSYRDHTNQKFLLTILDGDSVVKGHHAHR